MEKDDYQVFGYGTNEPGETVWQKVIDEVVNSGLNSDMLEKHEQWAISVKEQIRFWLETW